MAKKPQTILELEYEITDVSKACKYSVESQFEIIEHIKHLPYALEIIIMPSGKMYYAYPTHIDKILQQHEMSRDELLEDMSPDEQLECLADATECLVVWENRYYGTANQIQYKRMRQLMNHGLYFGDMPEYLDTYSNNGRPF